MFVGRGRGQRHPQEEGVVIGADNVTLLILRSVFSVWSGSHQSHNHSDCFLVVLADSALGHRCPGPSPRLFGPVLTSHRFEA